ncbi:DNA mismatch repair protein MutS [uncultured Lutibacter sp.]|uniref:MutS-related protein n=1 Tax=uncultured Lutibacter sp. TaxID=437739 RepID=UPI0026126364|nr:DNA mismatch repair protein MutS [uncultured Lutibacter sp.]
MNWILGFLFVLIIVFLYSNYANKKKLAKLKKRFIENWGNPKSNDYFNFYVIGAYFENNEHKNKAFHVLSEKIKIDLDIDELFKFIDRTSSKIGQQYLYFKLRTIGSIERLLKFDLLSNLFLNNDTLRLKSQLSLSKINSNNSYDLEKLITDKPIEKPAYLKFIYASSFTSVLLVVLTFFNPVFSLFLLPIFIINTIFHYKNKENVTYYTNAVYQLSRALKVSKELSSFDEIKQHFSDLSFIKKVSTIQTKTEFIGFEKQLSNEYALFFWLIIELIKIQFMVEYILFFSFIDSITKEKNSIEKMFCFIGEIDSAISTASLKAGENKICMPNFTKEKQLISTEIYHPLIENCITNNINLIDNSLLLTGSNMSGKTTFIRTIAINSILAQTLNVCFAKEYTAPFLKVYSSIRITDDLLDNTSYYLEEVLTIKELVDAAKNDENCLFVLDEIFKGTNTIERISGGKAILSYLNKKNHLVLVSTHDIELTDLLVKENYELYHFSEQIESEKLFFDHKLKSGKLKTRNAIKILELYKYPPEIIIDARKTEENNFS